MAGIIFVTENTVFDCKCCNKGGQVRERERSLTFLSSAGSCVTAGATQKSLLELLRPAVLTSVLHGLNCPYFNVRSFNALSWPCFSSSYRHGQLKNLLQASAPSQLASITDRGAVKYIDVVAQRPLRRRVVRIDLKLETNCKALLRED